MGNVQEHVYNNLLIAIVYACCILCVVFILWKNHKTIFRLPVVLLLLLCLVQCAGRIMLAVCYSQFICSPTDSSNIHSTIYVLSSIVKLLTLCLIPTLLLSYWVSLWKGKDR